MSCCHRHPSPAPPPRWPEARATPAHPASATPGLPRLRYTGTLPLSLPVGTRRVTVHPGLPVEVPLTEAEHRRLWRTGWFEAEA